MESGKPPLIDVPPNADGYFPSLFPLLPESELCSLRNPGGRVVRFGLSLPNLPVRPCKQGTEHSTRGLGALLLYATLQLQRIDDSHRGVTLLLLVSKTVSKRGLRRVVLRGACVWLVYIQEALGSCGAINRRWNRAPPRRPCTGHASCANTFGDKTAIKEGTPPPRKRRGSTRRLKAGLRFVLPPCWFVPLAALLPRDVSSHSYYHHRQNVHTHARTLQTFEVIDRVPLVHEE